MSAMTEVVIRRAQSSDFADIFALLQHYYIEYDIRLRESPEKTAADLSDAKLGFFLVETDGEPAGCVLLRPLLSVPSATECKRLFVMPQFRSQGLASKLMDAAEAHARNIGLRWIYLDSRTDMTAAIALYRRRGYEEIPRFNDNAEAAIFLRKRLVG